MDPKLAEMYGTNVPDEADLQKLAAAELAEQLSEGNETSLDDIDADQLEALAQDVLGVEEEGGEDGDDEEEEGQQKLAEADYLGRVMAHSMTQELREIEKVAAEGEPGFFRRNYEKGKGHAKNFGSHLSGSVGGAKGFTERLKGAKGHRAKVWGARGGAAAAAGAAGYGAKKGYDRYKKGKKKQSSALDTLVEQRAYEILEENGIDIEKVAAKETEGRGNYRRPLDLRPLSSHEKKGREEGRTQGTRAGAALGLGGGAYGGRWASKNLRGHGWKGQTASALGGAALGAIGGSHVGKHVGASIGKSIGTGRGHDKQSSALDTLIEQRAYEILAENGVDVEAVLAEQEKTSGAGDEYDVLEQVVEENAWQLLAANGFVSDEDGE